jgi:hypothetical protein
LEFCTRGLAQPRDAIIDMNLNIRIALLLIGIAAAGLAGCASDEVTTTSTTETTETRVANPSVSTTTESHTLRY